MKTGPLLLKILDSPISMDSCIVQWWDVRSGLTLFSRLTLLLGLQLISKGTSSASDSTFFSSSNLLSSRPPEGAGSKKIRKAHTVHMIPFLGNILLQKAKVLFLGSCSLPRKGCVWINPDDACKKSWRMW